MSDAIKEIPVEPVLAPAEPTPVNNPDDIEFFKLQMTNYVAVEVCLKNGNNPK